MPERFEDCSTKVDLELQLSIRENQLDAISFLENSLENIADDETVLLSNWHVLDFLNNDIREESQKEDAAQSEIAPMIENSKSSSYVRRKLEQRKNADSNNRVWPYLLKVLGAGQRPPPREGVREILLAAFASFLCILILGLLEFFLLKESGNLILIPAFGAMAVVLFTKIGVDGSLAQPPNVFFGHLVSAVVGVTCQKAFGFEFRWLAGPVAVALTIAVMSLTSSVHPAAGATTLIAVYGGQRCTDLGYWFVLLPVFAGTVITFIIALLINNLSPRRRYPKYWSMK